MNVGEWYDNNPQGLDENGNVDSYLVNDAGYIAGRYVGLEYSETKLDDSIYADVYYGDGGDPRSIDYYSKEYDLPNLLPEDDGTPLGLKALLFSRYDYWNGFMGGSRDEYAQSFKNWYLEKYVAKTKTHRQQLNR